MLTQSHLLESLTIAKASTPSVVGNPGADNQKRTVASCSPWQIATLK